MGSDGGSRASFPSGPMIFTSADLTPRPIPCSGCEEQAFLELDTITRPKVWLHRDEWSWKPWIGHSFFRVTVVLGRLVIDVCRCRCRACRDHVAQLRARCDAQEDRS